MNSLLIRPLSFLLAILWYEPTRDGEQRVLPFALVTTFDLLTLFIFLFQRQIGHWHDILTSDIEQGHLRAGSIDGASVTLEHRDFGARPDTPQSEISQIQEELVYDIDAINRSGREVGSSTGIDTIRLNPRSVVGGFGQRMYSSNVGWNTGMVQSVSEGQEMEEVRADLGLGQQERRGGFFIDVGMDIDSDSGFETIHPSCPVGTPATIYSNIHPAYRPTFENTSRPASRDSFQTPKQSPVPLAARVLEQNQI
jgi:hypothetical protein